MKQTLLFIGIALFCATLTKSQNVLSNGDFEIYSVLPDGYGQVNRAVGWTNVNGNYSCDPFPSPDYYHEDSWVGTLYGPIYTVSGKGQMGFITYNQHVPDFREYISCRLDSILLPLHRYRISFYLTNGNGGVFTKSTNNIGIYFSKGALTQVQTQPVLVDPQIEMTDITCHDNYWEHYTYHYYPVDTVDQVTIGNFRNDLNTQLSTSGSEGAYYFIDDIEVVRTDPVLVITGRQEICIGDSTELTASGDTVLGWASVSDPGTIFVTGSSLTVSPDSSTTYFAFSFIDTVYFTVHVYSSPEITIGNDTLLCEGDTMRLDATTQGATYRWQDATANSYFEVTEPGNYWVEVFYHSCKTGDTVMIYYDMSPELDLGNDTSLCFGQQIQLKADIPGASYIWQDNSTDSVFLVDQAGIYVVEIFTDCWSVKDSILVGYKDCSCFFHIPDAFTPNGDGLNDSFMPVVNCELADYLMIVFDRWGRTIFESRDFFRGWDGTVDQKPAPNGVYVYRIWYQIPNESPGMTRSGTVTLLR